MTVYVDPIMAHGWRLRGKTTPSCHMFSSRLDLTELHQAADSILLRRHWFQGTASTPHYDLTPSRRDMAVHFGATEVDRRQAVEIWQARRAARAQFLALWAERNVDVETLHRRARCRESGTIEQMRAIVLQLQTEVAAS